MCTPVNDVNMYCVHVSVCEMEQMRDSHQRKREKLYFTRIVLSILSGSVKIQLILVKLLMTNNNKYIHGMMYTYVYTCLCVRRGEGGTLEREGGREGRGGEKERGQA